jgi:hypothetical protein
VLEYPGALEQLQDAIADCRVEPTGRRLAERDRPRDLKTVLVE